MRVLVLGGTAWLGGEVATEAVAAGHEVVCLARGESGAVPPGAELVRGDRRTTEGYAGVTGEFDLLVDVARDPLLVRTALDALADRVRHWVFVSTINVYADASPAAMHAAEDAPLHDPWRGTDYTPEVYGAAKVACEQLLTGRLDGERVTIARAGLIGGPGDHTGRTGYWPSRFAQPSRPDGAVLVPHDPDAQVQLIDVRDLAGWLLRCGTERIAGVFNATGPAVPLAAAIATARRVAGHTGPTVGAEPGWLTEHRVEHWAGPRSLPLWLPWPQLAGMMTVDRSAAARARLTIRPLAETFADVLAWERTTGPRRPPAAGLAPAEEAALITELLRTR
ncbi:NAD-dependent epimerase/dehydratase family protein [Calidifontibacter sp. DB0510]|uniref:NAD-dependent epimerase/dehydratase family protein n=1 Tax=Metallococcus carri TaxID=1656884 RepID=A0A967B544_9MICO|nr:NAD-dependent epimerase/dehydratase family protein [Metallococcus carri]NHN54806.1 NAD-dependent epimerase/dehydratase family protein [Metallococcus carri]NOP37151.1 NAD-dependent epimerase/dehydratase family protein [Calidifontibacter sp. DB2511S]